MKLADDALLCIIEAFRKGLMEERDISDLLRQIDLVEKEGKLGLTASLHDVWKDV